MPYRAPRKANCEARRRAGKLKFGTETVLRWTQLVKKSAVPGTPCGPLPAGPKITKLRKFLDARICGGKNATILNFL